MASSFEAYLNFGALLLWFVCTISAAIIMLKRNPHFIANQFFFLAYIFYFTVGLSMWLYTTFPDYLIIQVFIRICIDAAFFGSVFLYLGTRVVFRSIDETPKKMIITLLIIAAALATVIPLVPNLAVTISLDPVDNKVNNLAMLTVMAWQIILIVQVLFMLLRLRRVALGRLTTEELASGQRPLHVVKMEIVIGAHLFALVGIFFIIAGNAVEIAWGDTLFYLLLCIDFIVTAYGILKTK